MKQKFIAHRQLIIYSNLAPIVLISLELSISVIVSLPNRIEIGMAWIAILAQFLFFWGILFIIYHNSYRLIWIDEEGVKTGRIFIKWEEIYKYKVVPIVLGAFPKIKLKPMLYIYDETGRKIRFALDDKRMKNMLLCSQGKSIVVHKIQKDFG